MSGSRYLGFLDFLLLLSFTSLFLYCLGSLNLLNIFRILVAFFFPVGTSLTMVTNPPSLRHEKSRKHASIACGHFWRKLWTFLHKVHISGSTFELLYTTLHYMQQFVHFDAKYPIKVTIIII